MGDVAIDTRASVHQFALETWIMFGGKIADRIRESARITKAPTARELRAGRRNVKQRIKNEEFMKKVHAEREKKKESLAKRASRAIAKFAAYRRQQG